jgi:hypothetical protein
MSAYTIRLLAENGAIRELLELDFESDDAAIDYAGSLPHPYAMIVRQGGRHVARFPPLSATLNPLSEGPETTES